jgi:hypothetical protein
MPARYRDGAPQACSPSCRSPRYRERVIPLPRAWLLTGAMLVGVAVGLLAGIGSTLVVTASIRPDVVIAFVVGVPSAVGMLLILFSGRRWITTLGAFVLALAPGWFGALVAIQVVSGA